MLQSKALTSAQIQEIAEMLNCEPAAVRAVIQVETAKPGNGFIPIFLPDPTQSVIKTETLVDHPVILFERHIFWKLTTPEGVSVVNPQRHPLFQAAYPKLCNPKPGGYAAGNTGVVRKEREIKRMYEAAKLDRIAAFQSASWGLPQILGMNHAQCECVSLDHFVQQMMIDEFSQMKLFVAFLKHSGLDILLRRLQWVDFARRYNGPAYAKNNYHSRLATAYKTLKEETR